MTRHRSPRVTQRDEELVTRLQGLQAEHPGGGYRRLGASWRRVEQVPVNKKWRLQLLREHRLLVTAKQRLSAKRTPTGRDPRPAKPDEW